MNGAGRVRPSTYSKSQFANLYSNTNHPNPNPINSNSNNHFQQLNLNSIYSTVVVRRVPDEETTVFTNRTPPDSPTSGKSNMQQIPFPEARVNFRKAERQYWKWNFRITFLPLICWGIPTHLVLLRRPITSTRQWIKSLVSCSNPCVCFLTLILFVMTLGLNGYILYYFLEIFIIVIIKGELRLSLLFSAFELFQNLPVLIPMNYLWLKGYWVRDLVYSFSHTMICESSEAFQYYQATSPEFKASQPSKFRLKMIIIYLIIAFVHVIHCIMYGGRIGKEAYDETTIFDHFGNYLLGPVLSTLVLPTYMAFCWACKRQFEILAFYLKSLINMKLSPIPLHFDRFKAGFKETSNRVQLLNSLYSMYISFILFSILFSMYVELWDLWDLFFGNVPVPVPPVPSTTPLPISPVTLTPASEDLQLAPSTVRSLAAIMLVVLLKVGLIWFSYWQAVGVNDEAKYLMVWLDDFVTEPNANLSTETYQAFRLLRFYVQSRMLKPRISLIRIPILSLIPPMQKRLHSYQQL